MRKNLVLLLTSLLLYADNNEMPPVQEPCCVQAPHHRLQIGPNYTYAWVTPKGNSTTRGSLGGAQAIYEYRPLDSFYEAIVFNWRMGSTRHSITKRSITDVHGQERLGYTVYFPSRTSRLSLFTGLGGRWMNEKVTVGSTSVTYNYAHFYVPVGFLADHEVNCHLNWGLGFQWRPQFYPTVQIVPINGARWMLTKKINNFYVEMPVTIKICDCFSFIMNPFFEYWNDGHTIATTALKLPLLLPSNQYYFAGLDVNLSWDF